MEAIMILLMVAFYVMGTLFFTTSLIALAYRILRRLVNALAPRRRPVTHWGATGSEEAGAEPKVEGTHSW